MNKSSKYIVFSLAIFGGCIGLTILTPRFNLSEEAGFLLGLASGFIVAMLIPNVRKSFLETVQVEHREAIEQNRYISFRETITHPTHLPMGLAAIWFIAVLAINEAFNMNVPEKTLFIVAFSPVSLSLLITGLIMIRRRELITGGWMGYVIKRTNWAIVLGILLITIGLGLIIGLILY